MTSLSVHQLQSTIIGEIKSNLMYKTGHGIIDAIILMVITAGLLYVMNSWKSILPWLTQQYKFIARKEKEIYKLQIKNDYTVSIKAGFSVERGQNEEQIDAVLHHLQKNNQIQELKWENTGVSQEADNTYLAKKTCCFAYILNDSVTKIKYNKYIIVITYKHEKVRGESYYTNTRTLDLISAENMEILKEYVQECYQEYVEYKYKKYDTKKSPLYYYNINASIEKNQKTYQRFQLNNTRQFSNLFFPEKTVLLKTLTDFMEKKGQYDSKFGLPYRCNILIYGPPGTGKCHAKDTPIIMFDGSIKMIQNIQVGDLLMGDDSTPREVLSLACGTDEMYDIIPVKGRKYTVNSEHILCLKYSSNISIKQNRKSPYRISYIDPDTYKLHEKYFTTRDDAEIYLKTKKKIIEISVVNYLKLSSAIRSKLKGYRVKINFDSQDIKFDPYIIGYWLGDGCSTGAKISSQDATVLKYLRYKLIEYQLSLNYYTQYDYGISADFRGGANLLLQSLYHYKLLDNKHIPHEYIANSREIRLQLLAGLIDSDGDYSAKDKCFTITQKSKTLSDDIMYLCQTLGFATYQHERIGTWTYKGITKREKYWRMSISGNGMSEIPTKIPRKRAIDRTQIKDVLVTGITIKSVGIGKYYGFTLNENNRYLLGDCTVTHNTSILKAMANMTKKHIINVNLKKIKTNDDLMKLFFQEEIHVSDTAGTCIINVPFEKRIYVLEEIDTIDLTHKRGKEDENIKDMIKGMINAQDKQSKETKLNEEEKEHDDLMTNVSSVKSHKYSGDDEITLGSLLVLLDGILELYGSILAMTTNHPEKLDPALIRQGRINYKLHLDHMKLPSMCEMVQLYTGEKYTVKNLQELGIKEGKHSAAEIEGLLLATQQKELFEIAVKEYIEKRMENETKGEKEEKWNKIG